MRAVFLLFAAVSVSSTFALWFLSIDVAEVAALINAMTGYAVRGVGAVWIAVVWSMILPSEGVGSDRKIMSWWVLVLPGAYIAYWIFAAPQRLLSLLVEVGSPRSSVDASRLVAVAAGVAQLPCFFMPGSDLAPRTVAVVSSLSVTLWTAFALRVEYHRATLTPVDPVARALPS